MGKVYSVFNTTNTMNTISKFDSGNWGIVSKLPAQDDMIAFMEFYFFSNPHLILTRQDIIDAIVIEFNIPDETTKELCPHCETTTLYTRVTYLISDAVQGLRKASRPFLKRIGRAQYQYTNGTLTPKVSAREISQAMVSVKMLENLSYTEEQIVVSLSHKWNSVVINTAINKLHVNSVKQ